MKTAPQTYLPVILLDSGPTRGLGPSTKLSLPGTAALRRGGSSAQNRKRLGSGASPHSSNVQQGGNPFPRSPEGLSPSDHSEVCQQLDRAPSASLRQHDDAAPC